MNIGIQFFRLFLLIGSFGPAVLFGQQFHRQFPFLGYDPYRCIEVPQGYSIGLSEFKDALISHSGDLISNNYIGFGGDFELFDWYRCADNGFLIYNSAFAADSTFSLKKRSASGSILWEKYVSLPIVNSTIRHGYLVDIEEEGGFYYLVSMVEEHLAVGGTIGTYLLISKIDQQGNVVWHSHQECPEPVYIEHSAVARIVGQYLYVAWGYNIDIDAYLFSKIGLDGIWQGNFETTVRFDNRVYDIEEDPTGGCLAIGNFQYTWPQQTQTQSKLIALNENMEIKWRKSSWPQLNALIDVGPGYYYPEQLLSVSDGWIVSGPFIVNNTKDYTKGLFIARLDTIGAIVNYRVIKGIGNLFVKTLENTSDGGYILTYQAINGNIGVVKMDAQLKISANEIIGSIFKDQNLNCEHDTLEPPVTNWLIELRNANDTIFTFADAQGRFDLSTDTGAHVLKIKALNPYWQACPDSLNLNFPGSGLIDTIDYPVQPSIDCPQMEVNVAIPFLRRCFDNTIYVSYCNNGTAAADASVAVWLAPELDFQGASLPLAGQSGDTLFFELGSVASNACGFFQIWVLADCDSTILGQTLCVGAHILPDTFCLDLPNWSGAQIAVQGACETDSAVFTIKNIGSSNSQVLEYVVIEDIVIWRSGTFGPLLPGETHTETVPPGTATARIFVEQEPGFPWAQSNLPGANIGFGSSPTAWVEGCGWDGSWPFPGGFVLQFPDEDGHPNTASDCRELIGSYDPNDKSASPEGIDDEHFILPGTPLEYLIRFQNTGTDTAFRVEIRDELSRWLDPASVQLLAASHAYRVDFEGERTLIFAFDDILLPDSNSNEAASHGFVQFRVWPRLDAPNLTRLENRAAIYFDFNEAIATNTTWHTIVPNLASIETVETFRSGLSLRVFPNPFFEKTTLQLGGFDLQNGFVQLFDAQNRLLRTTAFSGQKAEVRRDGLPAGLYFFRIVSEGRTLASGKVLVGN